MQLYAQTASPANLVNQFIQRVINEGDFTAINELVSRDYHYQAGSVTLDGSEQLSQLLSDYRTAFPDLHLEIIEQIEQNNKVVTRGCLNGTQLGPFQDLPASGRRITIDVIIISTVVDGRIFEEFEILDELAMLQQLALVA